LKNAFLILKGTITLFVNLLKRGESPKQHNPNKEKFKTSGTMDIKRKRKAEIFAENISEFFSPHNNDQEQEVEQDLATPIQLQESLKLFHLKGIKDEIKILNKKDTKSRPYYYQNAKLITKRSTSKRNVYIQRRTTTRILA
jgi:hypothetical protein